MSGNGQKMSGNDPRWSGNDQEMSGNVREFSGYGQEITGNGKEMSRNGQEMSRNGLKLSRYCLLTTKKEREKYTLYIYVQPERRRRKGWQQKKETLNYPPHFYGSIFFLCSFLFSLFKSFHMAS